MYPVSLLFPEFAPWLFTLVVHNSLFVSKLHQFSSHTSDFVFELPVIIPNSNEIWPVEISVLLNTRVKVFQFLQTGPLCTLYYFRILGISISSSEGRQGYLV